MRIDYYTGETVPETLGEYRDLCVALGGPDNGAVAFLDKKICANGRDDRVIVADSQMRMLLFPMLLTPTKGSEP